MRIAVALVVASSLSLSSIAEVSAEAIGAEEPAPAWSCSASGVEAARIVSLDAPFSRITARDLDALILEPSDAPYVIVEADTSAIAGVAAEISDGELAIRREGCTASASGIRVIVGVGTLDGLEVDGVARVRSRRAVATGDNALIDIANGTASDLELRGADIALFATGGGFHRLRVEAATLIAHQAGPGVMRVSGRAARASLGQDGAGYLVASDLEAADVLVDRAGYGEIHLAGGR